MYTDNELATIHALPTDSVDVKVRKIVENVLGTDLTDDASIIDFGLNSLSGM
jgi:hypothetical protein